MCYYPYKKILFSNEINVDTCYNINEPENITLKEDSHRGPQLHSSIYMKCPEEKIYRNRKWGRAVKMDGGLRVANMGNGSYWTL